MEKGIESRQKNTMRFVARIAVYIAGMWTVSAGIVFCVKSGLGISPVSSIPYVLSLATPLSLGTHTMLFHFINTVFQYVMEKKPWNPKVFLQIPVAFLFGCMIDLLKEWFSFPVSNPAVRIILLMCSIFCTALGMVLMINMRLVQNPPDGSVKAISAKTNVEMGKVKTGYDCCMVILSVGLGMLLMRRVEGFGIATIASALLVGRTLSVLQKYAGEKLIKLSY